MTPEIEEGFSQIRARYGAASLRRVEDMMGASRVSRHPLQQQAKYVMPGMTSKPWHDPYEYEDLLPIVRGLEALQPTFKAEIHRAIESSKLPNYAHYKVNQDTWKALYLFRNGAPVAESENLVPATFRFMKETIGDWLCPLLEMHYSILAPGAIIPPHCDFWNFTINLHLAVDIPENCGIRVANIERTWTEGKCLLFDYSYLHDAWNRSQQRRICLLMDLWNPEVTPAEREGLVLLMMEIRRLMEAMESGI